MAFETVDPKALTDLLASSRERGVYEREANAFMELEVPAARVELNGKKVESVAAGFRNLARKDEWKERIRVISNDDGVYLVNIALT